MKLGAVSNVCDICGKPRAHGNHTQCSRIRKANGFMKPTHSSEAKRLAAGRNAQKHFDRFNPPE